MRFPRFHRDMPIPADLRFHPRAVFRWIVSRIVCVVQFCHRCGRRDGLIWWAPDELWTQIMGGPGGVRCVRCFDRECQERGIGLLWVPRVDARKDAQGRWSEIAPPDPELFPIAAERYRQEQEAQC